jgi:hypothetical protein
MPRGRLRFDVTLNGKHLCTSGVANYGVADVIVTWVRRNPKEYVAGQSDNRKSSWSKEFTRLSVGGLQNDEFLTWGEKQLRPGDELVVKVLSAGRIDNPITRWQSSDCLPSDNPKRTSKMKKSALKRRNK